MSVFIKIKDQEYGPFSIHELKNMAGEGVFGREDLIFHEESQEWVKAAQVDEMHQLFTEVEASKATQKIIAIGGGKGGVGKTVLTASLGIGLATLGHKVVIVDADLGGANLHTCMGILEPEVTFYDFYTLQKDSLSDILLDTPVENLKLISGACGTLGLANPRYAQKVRFINQLRRINSDYILLDLGAGASYNVIDFFLAADHGIAVTTPEPMAIQETFNFIKISLMRKLFRQFKNNPEVMSKLEQDAFSETGRLAGTLSKLIEQVRFVDSVAAEKLQDAVREFSPSLILNMVHHPDEVKEGMALRTAAEELLSINMDFLGYIDYDESVRKAVKELRPFIIDNPKSKASRSLARLVSVGLLGKKGWSGYKERRQILKNASADAESYPSNQLKESDTICSVQCFYWGDCEYQNGGYPCPVRHLDAIFRR